MGFQTLGDGERTEDAVGIEAGVVGIGQEHQSCLRVVEGDLSRPGCHLLGTDSGQIQPASAVGQGEGRSSRAEGDHKGIGAAACHQGGGGGGNGLIHIAGKDVLVRLRRETEIVQHHLVKAHIPDLVDNGGDPAQGIGAGGIQPEAAAAVHPQARPAFHIQAAGHVPVAEIVIPEGGYLGDHVKALGADVLDQLVHRRHVHAGGADRTGELGGVVEGAIAALQLDHDGGSGLQAVQIRFDLIHVALEGIVVDVVAVQGCKLRGQLHRVGALVEEDGHGILRLGRGGNDTHGIQWGTAKVQGGTLPGVDHVALHPDVPAKAEKNQHQQQRHDDNSCPLQCSAGFVR